MALAPRTAGFSLPGVTFTATGLAITEPVTFESWARLVAFVGHLHETAPWWLGDLLVHGERVFGEQYAQAVGGRTADQMKQYAWVAARFPPERRRAALSWSAHRSVSALEPADADALLERAEAEGLGSRELRALTSEHRALAEPDEMVSLPLRVTRVTAARLHELAADGRSVSEVVADLVNRNAP